MGVAVSLEQASSSSVPELISCCKLIFFRFGGKRSLIEIHISVLGAALGLRGLSRRWTLKISHFQLSNVGKHLWNLYNFLSRSAATGCDGKVTVKLLCTKWGRASPAQAVITAREKEPVMCEWPSPFIKRVSLLWSSCHRVFGCCRGSRGGLCCLLWDLQSAVHSCHEEPSSELQSE